MFFHKKYQSYVKAVKESKYLIRISICRVVLELWPKICQNKKFSKFSPSPKKHKNKAKIKLANFYMSGIFSFLNILIQTYLESIQGTFRLNLKMGRGGEQNL